MRLLFVATHPSMGTGYARVGGRLAADLAALRGVSRVTYWAMQRDPERDVRPPPEHPALAVVDVADRERRAGVAEDARGLGVGMLAAFLADTPHDAVLIYNDPLVVSAFADALRDAGVPVHAYLDVVSDYLGHPFLPRLSALRSITVFTEDRARGIRALLPAPPEGARVAVAPHGVDPETFFPLDRRLARAAVLTDDDGEDDFLFLCSATNIFRKRLDVSAAAFAEVYARWTAAPPPGVRRPGLVLFSPTGTFPLGAVLWAELARRGLDPAAHAGAVRVVEGGGTLGDAELNLVLNACDAGLHVSGAEGFGLGAVEHALTGAPQVFTLGLGDAAGRVLGEDRGYGVRPCGRVFTPRGEDGVGGWVAQLDAEEVAAAMWRCLTAPPAEREDIARRARAAVLEGLPWEGVAEQLLGSTSHP